MVDEISCGGLIVYKDKVLIIKSAAGVWNIPKGHVKPGESFKDCVIRELKEETGIADASFASEAYFSTKYTNKKFNTKKTVNIFILNVLSDSVKKTSECVDHRWIPIDEMCEKLNNSNCISAITKAVEFLKKN